MKNHFFMAEADGYDGKCWFIFCGEGEYMDFICECASELTALILMRHLEKTNFIDKYAVRYCMGVE